MLNANNENRWTGVVTVIPPQTTVQEAKDETSTGDWLAARRVNFADARLNDLVGLTAAKREVAGLAARLSQRQAIIEAAASVTRGVGSRQRGVIGATRASEARPIWHMLSKNEPFAPGRSPARPLVA